MAKRIRFGPVVFTAALAGFLGLFLVLTMHVDLPAIRSASQVGQAARDIASVVQPLDWISLSSAPLKPLSGPEEVELDCSSISQRPPFVSKSPFIRFVLRGCSTRKIVNARNQYEASLFEFSENHTSSDYISLASGANEIKVETEIAGEPANLEVIVIYQ